MNPPREIHLHIERLVLDGLPIDRSQGAMLIAAVETNLSELLSAPGRKTLPDTFQAKLSAPAIVLPVPFSPALFGAQIARAAHAAVTHTPSPTPEITKPLAGCVAASA